MNELIAKKYVQALSKSLDTNALKAASEFFDALAEALKDSSIMTVLNAPEVSKEKRFEILSAVAQKSGSKEIENLLRLLVENSRVVLISDIAKELDELIAKTTNSYSGTVYSDSQLSESVLNELSQGLSKKFNATIALEFQQSDYDGIKVDVEGLGVEISFSKSRINKQIVDFILQAI